MEFWQQVISTLFGAFAGAGAALLAGYLVTSREATAKEEAALNGLLLDFQLKRAFAEIQPRTVAAGTGSVDIKRCAESVLDSRSLIRGARLQLKPRSPAFENLARMSAACNTYLQNARREPEQYQFALVVLRSELDNEAKLLAERPSITYRMPGGNAYFAP